MPDLDTLEKRVRRLEDVEDIRKLMARYAEAVDDSMDEEGVAACFTEDAVWSGQPTSDATGSYRGRDAIREAFRGFKTVYGWTMHNLGNALIDVANDGQSAKGTWYLVDPCEIRNEETGELEAAFITGHYDNSFSKIDGKWYIKELNVTLHNISSWDEGWLRQPLLGQ